MEQNFKSSGSGSLNEVSDFTSRVHIFLLLMVLGEPQLHSDSYKGKSSKMAGEP